MKSLADELQALREAAALLAGKMDDLENRVSVPNLYLATKYENICLQNVYCVGSFKKRRLKAKLFSSLSPLAERKDNSMLHEFQSWTWS